MYTRPKVGETEEDLLRLQDEFLKKKNENRIKPAATVVVVDNKKEQEPTNDQQIVVDIQEQIANTFEAIPNNDAIGTIVERKVSHGVTQLKFNKNRGFPQAKRRDLSTTNNNSGGSIFARNIKKMKSSTTIEPMEIENIEDNEKKVEISDLPNTSFILTGTDRDEIHKENMRKLESMSEDEIKEERERLLTTMDPAIVAYLKSKRQQQQQQTTQPSIKQQNEVVEDIEKELDVPNELLKRQESEKWLNFHIFETNKLAWMKNIEIPMKNDKRKSFEARFDFDGWLMPFTEDEFTEKSRILYHHGDDSGRPGYTLQELIQLARSDFLQQKIIALNTIANILSLESTGIYDDIIDIPIEHLFFVLRFCLDDNTPSVLNVCLKAFRNLIFNKIDETCLDCLLGFNLGHIQPLLCVDMENQDDITENDQQLIEKNVIRCLIRTEILIRIRYIINTVQPTTIETIVYCIEILIRLARDSEFVTNQIYQCDNLIESIIKFFIPKNTNIAKTVNGIPLLQAVKLIRILSCRNKDYAKEFIEKYSIMDSLLFYLSSEKFAANTNGLRLQIECFHLWSVFVHYGYCCNHFEIFHPILMETLNYHYNNTNLEATFVRHGHVSGLLNLIGNVALKQPTILTPYIDLIIQCLNKWLKQFMKIERFECGKLQIISSIFYCLTCCYQTGVLINDNLLQLIMEMVQSKGFDVVTKTIKNGSMLLNNYQTHQTTANLKTLEATAWDTSEHIVPILQTTSCLPFLTNLSNFIVLSNNNMIKRAFLTQHNIVNYINDLIKSDQYYLTNNWFTRIENILIMNLLKCCTQISLKIDDIFDFYQLAVKCTCTFNCQQKPDIEYILINVIFNPQFYPTDVLMRNLNINANNSFELSLNYLDDIKRVYIEVLGLQKNIPDFTSNLCLDVGIGNIIPVDWIFMPIILLHQQSQQIDENQQIFIVKNCLRWILIYETLFPQLMTTTINPTDYYCRIACTFLLSDSLFLIKEIHDLLDLCLRNLIRNQEFRINFNRNIHGLNNFQDFYKQLLEQYQSVSYGDVLFGNFVLIPLVQRHNVKWRKILWSEYMGVVEIFNTTPEQSVCPLELFLRPEEEHVSLLKCYRRALVNNSIRKHSILYSIAEYHVKNYIVKLKQKK